MRLENKVALITGAASGIGKSCAELFTKEGAIVIVADIDDVQGQDLINQLGNNSVYHHLDVRNELEWVKITNFIQSNYTSLDVIINNAGITGFVPDMGLQDPEHATLDSWHYVHSVNLDSVFLGCKYAIKMMKNNGGSIINISSRSGVVGIPRAAAYASSKAAVRNHTKTVALYCAEEGYNIRCNSIQPAAILTPMWDSMLMHGTISREEAIKNIVKDIPLKTMGKPKDVAYAAVYLASNESSYVTGTELSIDGGILAGSLASPK